MVTEWQIRRAITNSTMRRMSECAFDPCRIVPRIRLQLTMECKCCVMAAPVALSHFQAHFKITFLNMHGHTQFR